MVWWPEQDKGGGLSADALLLQCGTVTCYSLGIFRVSEVTQGEGCFKLSNKRDLVRFIPCGISTAQNSVCLVKDTQISVGGG